MITSMKCGENKSENERFLHYGQDFYFTGNPQITLWSSRDIVRAVYDSGKKYKISTGSGFYNGAKYVCATCCGSNCSDCRYCAPDKVRYVTYIPESSTSRERYEYSEPISNKIVN